MKNNQIKENTQLIKILLNEIKKFNINYLIW